MVVFCTKFNMKVKKSAKDFQNKNITKPKQHCQLVSLFSVTNYWPSTSHSILFTDNFCSNSSTSPLIHIYQHYERC